jgi:hypothetical protein
MGTLKFENGKVTGAVDYELSLVGGTTLHIQGWEKGCGAAFRIFESVSGVYYEVYRDKIIWVKVHGWK